MIPREERTETEIRTAAEAIRTVPEDSARAVPTETAVSATETGKAVGLIPTRAA